MGFLNNLTWRYFRMNLDIFTSDQHPETEEYSTWAFHSHVSLGNPRKERGIKRITNSEQLIKPTMSFLKYFRFKKSQHDPQRTASKGHKVSRGLATEHYREPQELQEPRRSMQITDYIDYSKRSLQQKTQSEEQVSEKAGLKYNIRDYYSYASLRNPFKEEESERVHSKFFTQPNLSRKQSQIDPQQPDFTLEKSKEFLRGLAAELNRVPQLLHHNKLKSEKAGDLQIPQKEWENITRPSEEYRTLAFHSHDCLENPRKQRGIKRITNSEHLIKPTMSLFKSLRFKIDQQQTDSSDGKSEKIPGELATEPFREPQETENLPQKIKTKWVRTEKVSEKTGDLQIPQKEWENITRPSAKVTLDRNTANPTLKLSVDGRSVRTKTYKEFTMDTKSSHGHQRKSKHQYNSWTCVQAQEGYSTGRHYWEVDVKGKYDWRIGVVSESAPRNGFINLNTAVGYWTLRLQLGSLMAMTVPVTKLNQAVPSKIGVRLDLEESQVSFYDVMKRKHIYTFQADFSKRENIYPVFGTVETDKPLRII